MPIIRIPNPLRPYVDGQAEVYVEGDSVTLVMTDLVNRYPTFRAHLYKPDGTLRAYINLFLHARNIKDLDGLETKLDEEDVLSLVPSIAGG